MTNPNLIKSSSLSKDDYIRQLQRKNIKKRVTKADGTTKEYCNAHETFNKRNKLTKCTEHTRLKSEKEYQYLNNFSFDKKSLLARNECHCNTEDNNIRSFYRKSLLSNGVTNSASARIFKLNRANEFAHYKNQKCCDTV